MLGYNVFPADVRAHSISISLSASCLASSSNIASSKYLLMLTSCSGSKHQPISH
jgi:hypothetical protein